MCIWWLVEMSCSQKCAKFVNRWGARYKTSIICTLSCPDFYNTRNQTLGEPWLRFVGNVASARHFQLLSEEDVDVKLPDCAMFCSTGPWPVPRARLFCKAI